MIYLFYIFLLLSLLLIERQAKREKFFLRALLIPFVYSLLIGLRAPSVGMDSQDYADYYQSGYHDLLEVGFEWLSNILQQQGFSYSVFYFTVAYISVIFITLAIIKKKGGDYTISALLLYVLTYSFLINGMRQGLACSMFLFASTFMIERKPVPYVLIILVSSLFHTSALILLPLYFLTYLNLKNSVYLIIYIISYVGVFYDISSYFPETILLGEADYSRYIDSMTVENPSVLGVLVSKSIQIIILLLMLKNRERLPASLINLSVLGFVLSNIGFHFTIIGRLTVYFTWFPYLLYWSMLSKGSKTLFNNREFTVAMVVIIHAALLIHSVIAPESMQLPYKFFWEI